MKPERIQTSEYCTVGHPDRTCDFIASYILDKYIEADSRSRVALEVQLKERYCTISGEITSSAPYGEEDIADFALEAIDRIGYTDEYQERFGDANAIYRYQEKYSLAVERLARETDCPLVDLRSAFLEKRSLLPYLCEDGIHPNDAGQKLIHDALAAAAANI